MVNNAYTRAAQNYKKEAVQTMSPGELVIALFDECLKMLAHAKEYIASKNIPDKSKCLQKAKKIINYLAASLDMQYPISQELVTLYEYYIWEITQVNIKNDPAKLDDLILMITDIRDGFKGANAKVASGGASA